MMYKNGNDKSPDAKLAVLPRIHNEVFIFNLCIHDYDCKLEILYTQKLIYNDCLKMKWQIKMWWI